ncbi:MAG: hypothetical protein CSA96_00175 [Bacteroidetes bacterium]|nr:MAG: hypothetical protein CSA96_00175 [Bacteroidota bacterium]
MDIPIWQYLVSMPIYIGLLLILVEIMRKNYKFAAIFWILALFTFPLWSNQLEGWFRWVKTLSVLVPTALIVGLSRIAQHEKREGWWTIFRKDWVLWTLYGILGLNILEASLKDLALGNYFNAASGFILIVTIPLFKSKRNKRNGWEISEQKPGDLIVYTDPLWNFLYTTWNIAFVYAENPGFAASSLCILLAAELYPILKGRPELYVTARVYTLAIHILIRATYDIFTPIMDSSAFANATIVHYWGIVNCVLSLPYLFLFFYRQRQPGPQREVKNALS